MLNATGGIPVGNRSNCLFSGLSTDSRKIKKDELFVALKGESFDGHEYVSQAMDRGALGAVVERPIQMIRDGRVLVEVSSTLDALGDIAKLWRQRFKKLKVIAVTGSNGKTTTKEMIACILGSHYNILKNEGNFNNLIGLPLTLLNLRSHHDVVIVELGMNTYGEIRKLASICKPDVGIITNIGRAHVGNLGGVDGVKRAKAELVEKFDNTDKTFIVNADDDRVLEIAEGTRCKKLSYAINNNADIKAYDIKRDDNGYISFEVKIGNKSVGINIKTVGMHNVQNALSAISVGSIMNIPLLETKNSLESFDFPQMRLQIIRSTRGFTLINDSYNANPDSTKNALDELVGLKGQGRAIAVLGDMLELGDMSDIEHQNIGKYISELGVDYLFSTGVHGKAIYEAAKSSVNALHAENHEMLAEAILEVADKGDVVLVKGSRGMKMEKIIEYLEAGQ